MSSTLQDSKTVAKTKLPSSNSRDGQNAAVHARPLPHSWFHRILIPDIPYIYGVPNIQALSNRSCPTGCAHHLVHHPHSALDPVSLHRHQVTVLAYLPPQSLKSLLLRLRIDPGADDKGNNIEERHPSVFWQELLGECQRQRRDDPANFHDRHEAGSDGRSDLMEGPRTSNDSHRGEIDCVLDWCDLHITQRQP